MRPPWRFTEETDTPASDEAWYYVVSGENGNGDQDAALHAAHLGTVVTVRFCTFYANDRHAISTFEDAHVDISNTIIAFNEMRERVLAYGALNLFVSTE